MASIQKYETKNGEKRYLAIVYIGINSETGKQVNKKKRGFRTQKEARAWAEKTRVQYAAGGTSNLPDSKKTYRALYKEWLDIYRPTVKPSTYIKTVEAFEHHILPIFGNLQADRITPALCRKALAEWQSKLVDYKKIYQRAKKIYPQPWANVEIPKVSKKRVFTESDFWTKEELNAFLDACKASPYPIDYPFFRLLAYTGMRRGEILALEWRHLDPAKGLIQVSQAITRDADNRPTIGAPKTAQSIRAIPLDQETTAALVAWHELNPETTYIFESSAHKPCSESMPRKHLQRLCEENGIRPIRVHGIRHTHCSLLFEAGMTPKEVQTRLGHEDISITLSIYTHVSQARQKELPSVFADFMNDSKPISKPKI